MRPRSLVVVFCLACALVADGVWAQRGGDPRPEAGQAPAGARGAGQRGGGAGGNGGVFGGRFGRGREMPTGTGIIRGRVVRIDPAARNGTVTVDVALDEALPRGARPDMSVDGNIELERLDNVLYVGRPAFGQEQSKMSLFKLSADRTTAALTPVERGRSAVKTIEVVRGLNVGACVVLTDMSQWADYDRLSLSGTPPCGMP